MSNLNSETLLGPGPDGLVGGPDFESDHGRTSMRSRRGFVTPCSVILDFPLDRERVPRRE